jgi:hypothetical protein
MFFLEEEMVDVSTNVNPFDKQKGTEDFTTSRFPYSLPTKISVAPRD